MKYYCKIFVLFLFMTCFYKAYSQNNDAGAVILKDISHISLIKSSLVKTDTIEVIILDKRGDNFSSVVIPYSKGDVVKIDYAWIEDAQGNIVRKLKKQEIADANYLSNVHFYSDNFKKYFQLRHNTYPYKIVYSYTITYKRYLHIARSEVFERVPLENGKLVVSVPKNMGVRHLYENMDPPIITNTDGINRYEWNYSYIPSRRNVLASEESIGKPRIIVVPKKFDYGVSGEFTSWEALGNWQYRLNDNLQDLPDSEKRIVDRITSGLDSDYEKARALYNYLQDNHRYISISVDLGGLKSYPAKYVCENR